MKKLHFYIYTLLFSLLCLYAGPFNVVLAAQNSKFIILYTNDVHTHVTSGVTYAGVAAHKKMLQAQYGQENVILVDAGDAIQGSPLGLLTKGGSIVQLLNTIGYDYITLGNHEFDYGMPRLFELIQKLNARVITCNITSTANQSPIFTPYAIQHFHGLKVAFVGISTPESITTSNPAYFQDAQGTYLYSFAEGKQGQELYATVQKYVQAARDQGAEIVIALAHLGIDKDASPWTSLELIQNTTGIDVLIDGHSHSVIPNMKVHNALGHEVLLTQTGSHLQHLGQLTLDISTKNIQNTLLHALPQKDPVTAQHVQHMQNELALILKKPVGSTAVSLISSDAKGQKRIRMQETNLGDLVADAHRTILNTDVALINSGSIAQTLNPGHITYEDILRILPYNNDAVSLQVRGQNLWDALEMGARHVPQTSGGFMQVSGISYTLDSTIPSSVKIDDKGNFLGVTGAYRVKNVRIQGAPLDPQALYSMASNNYIALHFGDGMTMFRGASLLKNTGIKDNEILMQYIINNLGGKVKEPYANPFGQDRIIMVPYMQ